MQAHLTFATCAQYGNMLLHTSAPRSLSASRLGAATAHAVALADRAVRGGSPPPRGAGSAWGGSPRGWSPEPAGCDMLAIFVLSAQGYAVKGCGHDSHRRHRSPSWHAG